MRTTSFMPAPLRSNALAMLAKQISTSSAKFLVATLPEASLPTWPEIWIVEKSPISTRTASLNPPIMVLATRLNMDFLPADEWMRRARPANQAGRLVITDHVMLLLRSLSSQDRPPRPASTGNIHVSASQRPGIQICAQGDHHLRRHGISAYADHDPLSADHPGPDRPGIGRGCGSRCLRHPSSCPRSEGWAADAESGRVHAVPSPHQAGLRCGDQHHHWRFARHDHGGSSGRTPARQARALLAQYGLDEFRHFPRHREDREVAA